MKKSFSIILALFCFGYLHAQNLEGNWQVTDYKLKKAIKDKDKLAFVMAGAKAVSFSFIAPDDLFISNPMLSKPTYYTWKYVDKKKTIIEAVEVNPTFKDSPSRWKLKILKSGESTLHLKDLGKGKKGNVWILSKQ